MRILLYIQYPLPSCEWWRIHVNAMSMPCPCHADVMSLSGQGHDNVMSMTSQRHANVMSMTRHDTSDVMTHQMPKYQPGVFEFLGHVWTGPARFVDIVGGG